MSKLMVVILLGLLVAMGVAYVAYAASCGSDSPCDLTLASCTAVDCDSGCDAEICETTEDCLDCGCETLCGEVSCCAK